MKSSTARTPQHARQMLEDQVVVVTGGAAGIGREIADACARHGARAVIVGDLHDGTSPSAAGDSASPPRCIRRFVRTDVSQRDDVNALLAAAAEFGGVDLMVCNAGIAMHDDGPDLAEARYRRLVSVNLDGVYFGAQAAGSQMRELRKRGSIVLMSSMGGLRGAAPTVVYSATKGAVILLAKSLADALGPEGIRVNAVCPGVIDTGLTRSSPGVAASMPAMIARTPLRRIGDPREIADVVVWLGSNMATFVTGAAVVADGGLSAVL